MGKQLMGLWGLVLVLVSLQISKWDAESFELDELFYNRTEVLSFSEAGYGYAAAKPLMVGLTLIGGAAAQGAGTFSTLYFFFFFQSFPAFGKFQRCEAKH